MAENTKYKTIINYITKKIDSGILKPGNQIETEKQLESKFSVSRVTVRKAIQELVKLGFLEKSAGKGTFVTKTIFKRSLIDLYSFTDTCKMNNQIPSTEVFTYEKIMPNETVSESMNLKDDVQVWHIERVRYADGLPITFEDNYIRSDYIKVLTKEDAEISIFKPIRRQARLSYTTSELEAVQASKKVANALDVKIGAPVLKAISTMYDIDNVPIQFCYNYHRSDRYKSFTTRKIKVL